jgi:hypothetical protein
VVALRWVDVALVLMTFPFIVVADLPVLGYAVGAIAWIASRALGLLVEGRAKASAAYRKAVGLNLATMLVRSWLVALAILTVGLAGEREDGLTAALLVLGAFTVYFGTALLSRALEGPTSR